jgi:1,4-alpha-glucan branching enzyme
MNEPSKPFTSTTKPPIKPTTPTPSQFSAGLPKAAPQARGPETKPQAPQAQAAQRKVRFELDAPKAWSVSVVGTFNDWKPGATPLTHIGGDRWVNELSLAPGRYEYRFVVDGKWIDDPKAKAYMPNPHGGRNAVVEL